MRSPALLTIVLIGLAGCAARTMPVYNVSSAPVVTSSNARLSTDQVRGAIVEALQDKAIRSIGWIVRQDDPGKIIAEIVVRSHRADVEIDYSVMQYSITYKDSENLLYDGTTSHRNYNRWITLLEQEINRRLSEV